MNDLSRFNVTTSWIKINEIKNFCFITTEAIAFNLHSYIVFRSLQSEKELYYRADLERGDGVAVVAGHKNFPIFAFAENCWNAKIYIVSYPEFTKISTFESKEESIFICLTFSETEHLIALTGMPDYKLQVWFWRTHDRLISKKTEIYTDKQTLSCSNSLPLTVSQLAFNKGELIVWEIHGSQKLLKLIKRKIELNFLKIDGPFSDVYTIEGHLLIINRHGDIYYVIPSTSSVNLVVKRSEGENKFQTCISYVRNGAIVAAPDGYLKFFKRQKVAWSEILKLSVEHPFASLRSYHENEAIIGTTVDGGVHKITLSDSEKLNITKLYQYNSLYKNFTLIYPHGDYLVAVDSFDRLSCIHIKSGETISTLLSDIKNLKEIILEANPCYPFVAIGDNCGNVRCVQLLNPRQPSLLTEFLLTRDPIQSLRFSNQGNYLIVIDLGGNHFVISSMPGSKQTVLHHFKQEASMKQFFAIESRNELVLLFLVKSTEKNDRIIKIKLKFDSADVEMEFSEWELFTTYATIMSYNNASDTIYAIREKCRFIEVLHLRDDNTIILNEQILTPHQLRHMEGYINYHSLITWGMDGIIAVYNISNEHELLCCFVGGNRHIYGVKKARCDPRREFVISLDNFGNLIASKLNLTQSADEKKIIEEILAKSEAVVKEKFASPTSGGFPDLSVELQGAKKFIDLKFERAFQMEVEESEEARKLLFKKLQALQQQVKVLLDENEANPEEEQLEIQKFNLNLQMTEQKEKEAEQERNQQDKKMMEYIAAQTSMNQWIVQKCWNHLAVKGTKIRGMFHDMFVENYPLLPEKGDRALQQVSLLRAIENSVAQNDVFLPWRPIPTIELEKILIKEPGMFEINSQDMSQYTDIVHSLMGTSTNNYFEISKLHYQQLDTVTFHQMSVERCLIESELLKLKKAFNAKFEAMHKTKDHTIHSIRFKNDRLRHIQSEMKILDELKGIDVGSLIQILDPDFQSDEIPDTVINVIESEVNVVPYISPSTEKVLREQEAAREKRRKELEADDFKARALNFMMDGVLEHKWEDEIKKNPKRPECLIKNKPEEEWNEVEIRQVQDFNQETEKLILERQKYRRMLYEEQKMLQNFVDEEIQKFNYNLAELSMEKLKSDMAVGQEEMKLLIMTFYNFKRLSYQKEEIKIRHRIENMKAHIEELSHIQTELQEWIRDIKNNYENLQLKDKTLEKQFKANFNEQCPQAPADQAFKYFKRRPKLQMRAQITSPILLEIAKRISNKKLSQNTKLLPSECTDFLNGLEALDHISTSTTGIDANSWQVLCKMRRIKVESEFKIKSLGLQLADAEGALLAFMKEVSNKRQYLQSIERQLVETKENRENDLLNRYVQIVMKRGLIEIPLTGSFSDFHNSVLIHRSDVADINKIILKAGRKKLLALSSGSMFRRKINHKEWEHKVLKLKVRDLKDFVKTIEKVKITKEVQQWLKRKERGWSENLDEDMLQKQIENTINSQEKILSDLIKEITALQNHINQKKREMKQYDNEIQVMNINVSEKSFMRDVNFERDELKSAKERMAIILERANIVRIIQQQHSHLLQLSTLLELQRLKTFPTLNVKQI